jgi:hypothetical protein
MAHSTLPQLASPPDMAAFVRDDAMTALAMVSAFSSLAAFFTVQDISLEAPSPSLASSLAKYTQTLSRASTKISYSSDPSQNLAFPAMPLAKTQAMSLVDVSPSTLMRLKDLFTQYRHAFSKSSRSIFTSVVMKLRVVNL